MSSMLRIKGIMNDHTYEEQERSLTGLLIVILFGLRDYQGFFFFYLIFPNLLLRTYRVHLWLRVFKLLVTKYLRSPK